MRSAPQMVYAGREEVTGPRSRTRSGVRSSNKTGVRRARWANRGRGRHKKKPDTHLHIPLPAHLGYSPRISVRLGGGCTWVRGSTRQNR
jgi:hypothetical protein